MNLEPPNKPLNPTNRALPRFRKSDKLSRAPGLRVSGNALGGIQTWNNPLLLSIGA